MTYRCICTSAEWAHHHVFGGVLICSAPGKCKNCDPVERQKPNGTGDLETRDETVVPEDFAGRHMRAWENAMREALANADEVRRMEGLQ